MEKHDNREWIIRVEYVARNEQKHESLAKFNI